MLNYRQYIPYAEDSVPAPVPMVRVLRAGGERVNRLVVPTVALKARAEASDTALVRSELAAAAQGLNVHPDAMRLDTGNRSRRMVWARNQAMCRCRARGVSVEVIARVFGGTPATIRNITAGADSDLSEIAESCNMVPEINA